MIKKFFAWFGVFTFASFALVAFSMGGVMSGIILLLLAFICSPFRYLLLNQLPEKFRKKLMVIAASVILFFASMVGMPTDSSTDLNSEIVEDVAESTTEVSQINTTSTLNDEKAEDISSTSAKVEEDSQKEKEAEIANKTTDKIVDKKATEESTATKKKEDDAAAKKAEADEATVQKAAEEAAATQKASDEAAAAQKAAAQKAAEEASAAQKTAEVAAVAQDVPQADSSTVVNGTESANALAVLQMGPTTGSPCWVPRNGGKKYHTNSSCSGMNNPIYTTVDTATACGFDACKKCH